MTNDSLLLSEESFFRPLGLQHFYDAFALEAKANLRQDALTQFQLADAELTSDLRLTPAAVRRKRWGPHYEQPNAPPARSARRDRVLEGLLPQHKMKRKRLYQRRSLARRVLTLKRAVLTRIPLQKSIPASLAEETKQYDLMLAAYREVGPGLNGALDDGWIPFRHLNPCLAGGL